MPSFLGLLKSFFISIFLTIFVLYVYDRWLRDPIYLFYYTYISKYFKKSKSIKADFTKPKTQNFSLPYNYMLYITNNPATSEKLQQTCKYFFAQNQIIIVDRFKYTDYHKFRLERDNPNPADPSEIFYGVEFNKIPKTALFWVVKNFEYNYYEEIGRVILPKFYQISSLKCLGFERATLEEAEFAYLAFSGKLERLNFCCVTIKTKTGSLMKWIEIYKKLTYLKEFLYKSENEMTTVEEIKTLHLIQHKRKLESFTLDLIISSPFIDVIYLWKFMKENVDVDEISEFEFSLRNSNLETNYSRSGKIPNLLFYEIHLSSYPYIIPFYNDKEFFQNDVIQRES